MSTEDNMSVYVHDRGAPLILFAVVSRDRASDMIVCRLDLRLLPCCESWQNLSYTGVAFISVSGCHGRY